MEQIKCPNCELNIPANLVKCPHCGNDLGQLEKKVCPECGKENFKQVANCVFCGYPFQEEQKTSNIVDDNRSTSSLGSNGSKTLEKAHRLRITSYIFFVISGIFFILGLYVKHVYANSDYSYVTNRNAYVGGDAYNFIINGTYFAGYAVLTIGFLICAIIMLTTAIKMEVSE